MDIPKTLFATLVKQGRMEMHLTQEALAEKLGISAAPYHWRPRTP